MRRAQLVCVAVVLAACGESRSGPANGLGEKELRPLEIPTVPTEDELGPMPTKGPGLPDKPTADPDPLPPVQYPDGAYSTPLGEVAVDFPA